MAHFTVLTRLEIEGILNRYNLGRLLGFKSMDGGLANSSVKVTTESGAYILSVCDEKEMAEIVLLCRVLGYLERHDFPTTRVVPTREGDLCIDYRGKPLYLKEYIDGEVVEMLTAAQLYEIGAALASLHEIPPPDGLPKSFSYGLECFDELNGQPSAEPYYQYLCDCRRRVEAARSEILPKGFVHGDLFFDNMLFAEGRLAALIDFEEACHYYKIFDLGMTIVGCCAPGGAVSLDLAAPVVDGYQSIRTLEAGERRLLQLHVEYGAAATSFWRYRQYNIRNPEPGMKDHYLAMVDIARQVQAIEAEQFISSVFSEGTRA